MERGGDPTAFAWAITVGYVLCGVACAWAGSARAQPNPIRIFWWALAAGFVMLGANKQLDLQDAARAWLRAWVTNHGLYDYREWFLVAGFAGAAMVGVTAAVVSLVFLWPHRYRLRLAFTGLATLGVYLAMRAATMLHIPRFFGLRDVAINASVILEAIGLVCVVLAAAYDRATTRETDSVTGRA